MTADPADVNALIARTLSELSWERPRDLVPHIVARKAVEVTLRAVTEAPDETQAAVAASYARGCSDGRMSRLAGAGPAADTTEENQRG